MTEGFMTATRGKEYTKFAIKILFVHHTLPAMSHVIQEEIRKLHGILYFPISNCLLDYIKPFGNHINSLT